MYKARIVMAFDCCNQSLKQLIDLPSLHQSNHPVNFFVFVANIVFDCCKQYLKWLLLPPIIQLPIHPSAHQTFLHDYFIELSITNVQ